MTDQDEVSALQSNLRNVQRQLDEARMTMRDQMAMAAMQAYFTDPSVRFGIADIDLGAITAYRIADAMLEARKQK